MLQNAYFLAKIGADTAENEQHFAVLGSDGILPCSGLTRRGAAARRAGSVGGPGRRELREARDL